ncbi:sugar-binding protein [Cohnella zeiphila]|uniref:FIVAR domain-containing protein n=1 Tax=Cohnella zeiphila TaxID=2761120 RepID=A0A7X0W0P3_9BACL|nr:sugar-binding protein [Cohnella zeiphila]MBB6735278.1 FIVAR domain-containing protein [Cohnella zeiphila]
MNGKFKWLKTLGVASLLLGGLNGLLASADRAGAAAGDGTGTAVAFDSSGKFKDTLDSLDHVFKAAGVAAADGKVTGPGDLYYYAGDTEFKGVTVDVNAVKWSLNYTGSDGLKVFEASYDSATGTFTDGAEVTMVRKLKPDLLTDRNQLIASYVSGPIEAGTRYLHVRLPESSYFIDSSSYGNFAVDTITMTSKASASAANDYVTDSLKDFSGLAPGADPSNLNAVGLTDPGLIWDARTFGNLSYVERKDATLEDRALTYEVPEGKTAKSVYAEGYFNFVPSAYFQVWASADGASYTNVTQSGSYHLPSVAYDSNWLPVTVDIPSLPADTRFVQIRQLAFTSGELYGMKHPRMTGIAIGYGEPADDGGSEETPGLTTIKQAGGPVSINGAVELDDSGKPTGEWQGANAITLAGITDANGDDHGAKIYFQYDADNLYVGALIQDPTPMINENTGSGIWAGDNLELFVGTEDLDYSQHPELKNTMLPSDVQVVLSGSVSNGPQSYVYRNSAFMYPPIPLEAAKEASGLGYTLEAAIPLSELGISNPWDGKSILLNAVLNDGGSPSRGQWGWTTTGETLKKSRGQWGTARLEAGSPPAQNITAEANVDESNRITVSGRTLDVAGKDVTLRVTDPNGATAYVDQAPSDSDGQYAFTFPIVGDAYASGSYTAAVGGDGVVRPTSVTFEFTPGDEGTEPSGGLQATISGPDTAALGSEIRLQAGVQGAGDRKFNMMQAEIHYDKEKLAFDTDPQDGSRLAADVVTPAVPGLSVLDAAIKPDSGAILVLLGSTDPNFAAQGPLFTVRAKAKPDAGTGDTVVTMQNFQLSDESDVAAAADGTFSIRLTAADHSALAAAIEGAKTTLEGAVEGGGVGQYPVGSKAALQSAIDTAQAVADQADATQEELAAALAALNQAVAAFLGSVNPPVVSADKTALEQEIAAAQAIVQAAKEGTKVGQYPKAARDALLAAVGQANGVLQSPSATQTVVDQAVAALQAAVQTFKTKLIALVPGELRLTIRDLSVLAKYYGMKSDDPHWTEIAQADLFDEGEITIRSLAGIAKMIVDDWLNE